MKRAGGMLIGRQWDAFELMSLQKKDPPKEVKEENVTVAITTSPKPPPKAPV